MHRALITGSGQLASALFAVAGSHGWQVQMYTHQQLDVTNPAEVRKLITEQLPDLVFHTAALTRVNYCEHNPLEAHRVNCYGTENVVAAAAEILARVVYFSTDYVFDGTKPGAWVETDTPNPLNEYGRSKLAGEEVVRQYAHGHVVRTSGVFGARADEQEDRNFFQAVINKLSTTQDEALVVNDQFTCVTGAPQLAQMVFELLQLELPTLAHLTCSGSDSWHGWARLAVAAAGFDPARVRAVSAAEYPTEVARPAYSVLASADSQVAELTQRYPGKAAVMEYIKFLRGSVL